MNILRQHTRTGGVLVLLAAALFARATPADAQASSQLVTQSLTIFTTEQQAFVPGYAVGNIAITNPAVADYRVQPGRREVTLFGKGKGETTLTVWDQKGVKRHEVRIEVKVRGEMSAETDLKDLLKDFPSVEVRRLGDKLVVTGTVSTQSDFDAVGRIASVGNAQNLVRIVKTGGPVAVGQPAAVGSSGDPLKSGSGAGAGAGAPAAVSEVEYEVELLEANIAFASGTYGRGIEPSGRSLYRQTVRAPIGGEKEVYVPGTAATSADADKQKGGNKGAPATGIKLTLRPTELKENGDITTFVLIETNLPVEGSDDPSIMRRARWELASGTDEPFGLAGAELLAMPQVARSGGFKLGRVMETANLVPGARRGTGYVPSYAVYYNKQKKTQLLAVFHPRLVTATPGR